MQEETNKLEEVLTTCYLDALEQFNDHKRERFKVVAGTCETVLMTFLHVDVQDGKLPECEQQGRQSMRYLYWSRKVFRLT